MEDGKNDDEITIDFSKIKKFFKKGKKEESRNEATASEPAEDSHKTQEEESIDFKSIMTNSKRYLVPLLILIPILLSIFFRIQPFYLPITDDWAENSVYQNIRSSISEQIDKQYPNLPDENKIKIINENLEVIKQSNGEAIDQQIEMYSLGLKQRMQDDDGQTYLLAIDPYLWYGESKNYIENGQFGNTYKDGEDWYNLRNGRVGVNAGVPFNSVMTVLVYKIIHPFNKDFSIMSAAFLVPLLIMTLAVIPIFFIGRRFAGNIGGFFAAVMFAIHPALLNRTVAGFSDTDPYTVFFPLLTIWLFFEALDAKTLKNRLILTSSAGLSLAFFNFAWNAGWWYTFDFIVGTMGLYLVYHIITNFKSIKENISGFIKGSQVKEFFSILGVLTIAFVVFRGVIALLSGTGSVLMGVKNIYEALIAQPLWFIQIKAVAATTLWPNVLTTVAELNPSSFPTIISSLGGHLLFWISVIGLFLVMFKTRESEQKYLKFAILLAIWFLASIYGALTSLRFIALIVPVFALGFGAALGISYNYVKKWASKELNINEMILKTVIVLVFILLLLSPVKSAWGTVKNEVPSFTDAWYDSLTEIKEASDDAIITSWWDFGHWFVAMSQRRVTFDGGDQGNRIHWVGKSLLTDDEDEAVAILRMLNCGQELAFDTIENYTNDSYSSKMLIDMIILMDKSKADETLKEAGFDKDQRENILELTHCEDTIDQYYITSQDMVSKAGVWSHFGNWDFNRAKMYNTVKKLAPGEGKRVLVEEFSLSEKDAEKQYYEIKSTPADKWITTWPNYVSQIAACRTNAEIVFCENGLVVNTTDYDSYLSIKEGPQNIMSLVYAGEDDIIEKEFNNSKIPYSAALIRDGDNYKSILMDPLLAKSTFTRLFFFDGLGSRYFRPFSDRSTFTGQKIQVWTVSFKPMDKLVPEKFGIQESEGEALSKIMGEEKEETEIEEETSNIAIEG